MRGNAVVRALVSRRGGGAARSGWVSSLSSCLSNNLISTPDKIQSPNWKLWLLSANSSIASAVAGASATFHLQNRSLQFRRGLCSSTGPSNILYINSDEEFDKIMNDVRGKSSDAIFYFTAVWCGPCRFISPVITELSKQLPHVTTYKIDIDQESVLNTLRNFQISSVVNFIIPSC
uniref:Thioredoxin domain-containing protein n=1 Tax=Rhizophora mucronata TaxID=61149 RepID=A0A2P2KLC2_RHIMU